VEEWGPQAIGGPFFNFKNLCEIKKPAHPNRLTGYILKIIGFKKIRILRLTRTKNAEFT